MDSGLDWTGLWNGLWTKIWTDTELDDDHFLSHNAHAQRVDFFVLKEVMAESVPQSESDVIVISSDSETEILPNDNSSSTFTPTKRQVFRFVVTFPCVHILTT